MSDFSLYWPCGIAYSPEEFTADAPEPRFTQNAVETLDKARAAIECWAKDERRPLVSSWIDKRTGDKKEIIEKKVDMELVGKLWQAFGNVITDVNSDTLLASWGFYTDFHRQTPVTKVYDWFANEFGVDVSQKFMGLKGSYEDEIGKRQFLIGIQSRENAFKFYGNKFAVDTCGVHVQDLLVFRNGVRETEKTTSLLTRAIFNYVNGNRQFHFSEKIHPEIEMFAKSIHPSEGIILKGSAFVLGKYMEVEREVPFRVVSSDLKTILDLKAIFEDSDLAIYEKDGQWMFTNSLTGQAYSKMDVGEAKKMIREFELGKPPLFMADGFQFPDTEE